jgi:hypothetical protein
MSKTSKSPLRRMAVLAIANRLGANQAPGDMVERVARVWRVDRSQSGTAQYTTNIIPVRRIYDESPEHRTTPHVRNMYGTMHIPASHLSYGTPFILTSTSSNRAA